MKRYQRIVPQVKETRQQKKVTAAPVRNNLDQGFDGRVGSYWYGETIWREGSRTASELGRNLVQGFENLLEITKNHKRALIIAHTEIHVGLCLRKTLVCGIYIRKQVINRKRKRLSK